LHFPWQKIADMLGVSERTIRRRRQELGVMIGHENAYSAIPDDELDVFVRRILNLSPESGERMVIGSLRAQGMKVQRDRIRRSIGRVDPISREMRRRTVILTMLPNMNLWPRIIIAAEPHLVSTLYSSVCTLHN
jgi:hypothetical protein